MKSSPIGGRTGRTGRTGRAHPPRMRVSLETSPISGGRHPRHLVSAIAFNPPHLSSFSRPLHNNRSHGASPLFFEEEEEEEWLSHSAQSPPALPLLHKLRKSLHKYLMYLFIFIYIDDDEWHGNWECLAGCKWLQSRRIVLFLADTAAILSKESSNSH